MSQANWYLWFRSSVERENMFDGLPKFCFVIAPTEPNLVLVILGGTGYSHTKIPATDKNLDFYNGRLCVTNGQAEAMLVGSVFGWDVPGANPQVYDDTGIPRASALEAMRITN